LQLSPFLRELVDFFGGLLVGLGLVSLDFVCSFLLIKSLFGFGLTSSDSFLNFFDFGLLGIHILLVQILCLSLANFSILLCGLYLCLGEFVIGLSKI